MKFVPTKWRARKVGINFEFNCRNRFFFFFLCEHCGNVVLLVLPRPKTFLSFFLSYFFIVIDQSENICTRTHTLQLLLFYHHHRGNEEFSIPWSGLECCFLFLCSSSFYKRTKNISGMNKEQCECHQQLKLWRQFFVFFS